MRLSVLFSSTFFLICSGVMTKAAVLPSFPRQFARMDTVIPKKSSVHPNNMSVRDIKPMILPGTTLDTTFSTLPAQSPAVGKAVPGWLRTSVQGSPLYVIDGQSATATQLRNLRQGDVVSTYQLEGRKAQNMYGKNARNGVFIITTKTGVAPK